MLAALIVSVEVDLVKSSASTTALPSTSLNAPRTLVTIACRATNPTRVCEGSMVQVPARSARVAEAVGVVVMGSS